ncbi:MAG TPA: glycosyltransferase family 4 protein [Gemmatimonadales bacterium]|jgi:glycosyltransferase involved in cell wall biosynthesis|nr:glycosyltransferase family 4 protein [Gemmatimonadales bacterium]
MTASLSSIQVGKGWFPEEPGGLDRYYFDLVRHLPASGVQVRGLVTGSARVARETSGAVVAFAPSGANLATRWSAARRALRQALAEQPGSVVAAHFALYAAPALDLLARTPFVMHFQGPWAAESRVEGRSPASCHVKYGIERAVYRRAAHCLVLSRAFGKVIHEDYGVPAEAITVVPGGIDCARWDTNVARVDARHQLGWPTTRPIVLVVRRLVRRMGLEGLIDSVQRIRRTVPDVLIVIGGSGPLRDALAQRAADRGATRHVHFAGFIPDAVLPVAYRAADLTVVPSVALEGFGLVAAESLASGTPVMVTAVGGLPETIEGLSPHCILPPDNPAALGRAIGEALVGRLPLPTAAQCVRHAVEHFDWSITARRIGGVYREVMR